jgi:hypothetical protein
MKKIVVSVFCLMAVIVNVSAQNATSKAYNLIIPITEYMENYVEPQIDKFAQKGEYESTEEFNTRVNNTSIHAMRERLKKEAKQKYLAMLSKSISLELVLQEPYDADNETFLITNNVLTDSMLLKVPKGDAPNFKQNWGKIRYDPQYSVKSDNMPVIIAMNFTLPDGKTYKYDIKESSEYAPRKMTHKYEPGKYENTFEEYSKRVQRIKPVENIAVGKSDVDMNIPENKINNEKTFAVIIANENYLKESSVEFAINDGKMFREYCIKTLGFPEKNIHYVPNATLNFIRGEIQWISDIAEAYHGDVNLIFYYAGHGIHDVSSKAAYLLPTDGYGSDAASGYKISDIYEKLGNLSAKSVIIFLDACFSGVQRNGKMLASVRGIAEKVEQGIPAGNMVVFSATQGNETAHPYKEKGHGLFTYFLLKKLQESKGDVTLYELSEYVKDNVDQYASTEIEKRQRPELIPSSAMEDKWKSIKLK